MSVTKLNEGDRRRTGKIASLPKEWRDVVNLMIRDGATYTQIAELLGTKGYPGIQEQNFTNWFQGGYQEWLKEQARLDNMKYKREFALQVVKENEGSQIHEAGLQIAASQIYELLDGMDVESLKLKLGADPENYSRLVNALAKLSDSGLKYQRYHAEVQAAKVKVQGLLSKDKGGITAETRQQIEQTLKLL